MTEKQRLTGNGAVAIFVCVLMLDMYFLSACETAFFRRLPGYHVTSSAMRTVACPVNKCSLLFCAATCTDSQCLAVSFHRGNQTCHLHDKPIHSPEVTYERSPDWEYLQLKTEYVLYSDWILIFRATRRINQSAYDTWTTPGHYDDYPALRHDVPIGCLSVNGSHYCDRHFKSKLIDIWNSSNVAQVRLVLYENGVGMENITFTATGMSSTTWFTSSQMMSSSWSDMSSENINYFSQSGFSVSRRWYVSNIHDGCPNDTGWMVVLDTIIVNCQWENSASVSFPVFLYAPNHLKTNWHSGFREADVMAIFVKLAP